MSSTISDVEKYLGQARDLEDYWMSNGWETLNVGEIEEVKILDIYPIVEVDISVNITIKLPNKIYSVPLADVSPLSVNDCLVIGVDNLYSDWEERVEANLGILIHDTTVFKDAVSWYEAKYLGKDNRIRVIRLKAIVDYVSIN